MKSIVFLYAEMMPYMEAVIKKLATEFKYSVHVVSWDQNRLTPYEPTFGDSVFHYHRSSLDYLKTVELIEKVNPSALYVSGRMDSMYLKVAKRYRGKMPVVSGIDTQYSRSVKSLLKILLSPFLYKPYFSHLWVPGDRQYTQAKALGYANENIISNLYTADVELFSKAHSITPQNAMKNLLFIGRLEAEKSFDVLLKAWGHFSNDQRNGWTLTVIGEGSLKTNPEPTDGIIYKGFLSQESILEELNQSSAFILPSKYEPWGVVVHEVASAGRLLICSTKVGAVDAFLVDGYNGFTLNEVSEDSMVKSLEKLLAIPDLELIKMAQNSRNLALRITPEISAASLNSIVQ